MTGPRVTDFSIDHILSSDFPHSAGSSKNPGYSAPPGEAYLHRVPEALCYADSCRAAPGGAVLLCVPDGLGPATSSIFSYGGFWRDLYPPDVTFHPLEWNFYPRHQVRDTAPAAGVQRGRTVFTSSQTRQLERLFHVTDYPAADARAALAVSSGLTEETVRVWFKNRRARQKKQKSRPKAQLPSRGSLGPLKPRDTMRPAAL